jgi:3-deoxy-manno-octulosonate cytidylyltransferase (CMP-KDO synthetase)
VGVYAYRRPFLLQLAAWPPGALEQVEKLEQLRVLERGYALAVEIVQQACVGIDTPHDYERFVARCRAREPAP